jgi:hypothetical protein
VPPDSSTEDPAAERIAVWPAFSSDAFLDVARAVYFPGSRKAVVECEGRRYRTLVKRGGSAFNGFWEFPLYLEPLEAKSTAELSVPFLDSVCRGTTASGETLPGLTPAPFIDWRGVTDWDGFLSTRTRVAGVDGFATIRRKERKLVAEVGPVEFRVHDSDPDVVPTLLAWKSAQYRRTGVPDKFAVRRNREFLFEMERSGLLVVSTLRVGGRLVAGNLGNRFANRFLSRLPAYDPAIGVYSPGGILTYHTVRASFEAGDAEFDFLIGGEAYKYSYASHVRWIGPIGREPLSTRLVRVLRAGAGGAVQNRRMYSMYRDLQDRVVGQIRRGRPAVKANKEQGE